MEQTIIDQLRLEGELNRKKTRLTELKRDKTRVSNDSVLSFITDEIKYLENSIEKTEFKIWKLNKGEN